MSLSHWQLRMSGEGNDIAALECWWNADLKNNILLVHSAEGLYLTGFRWQGYCGSPGRR